MCYRYSVTAGLCIRSRSTWQKNYERAREIKFNRDEAILTFSRIHTPHTDRQRWSCSTPLQRRSIIGRDGDGLNFASIGATYNSIIIRRRSLHVTSIDRNFPRPRSSGRSRRAKKEICSSCTLNTSIRNRTVLFVLLLFSLTSSISCDKLGDAAPNVQ